MNALGTIDLWLGPDLERVLARSLQDISQYLSILPSITIASNTTHPNSPTHITTLHFAALLRQQDGHPAPARPVSIIQPDDTKTRLAASLRLAKRYQAVVVTAPGTRYSKLQVRREIAEAQALIGISSVGSAGALGPLAIGLWSHHIDPRLSVPLLHPARREPATADVALAISPTLAGTLLIGEHRGYVVCGWAQDLIAAELAGLGLWTANLSDNQDRIGPWEDPVVQRATELDLGVQLPSDLSLRPMWAGDIDDARGIATMNALASTITALLNIDADQFQAP